MIPFLPGYKYFVTSSISGKAGGVVIYVENEISVRKIDVAEDGKDSQVEVLTLELLNKSSIISLIYRHPKGNLDSFLTSIENILCNKELLSLENDVIICGDFNLNTLNNSKHTLLYKSLIQAMHYTFLINQDF